jgi:hypothetical protein
MKAEKQARKAQRKEAAQRELIRLCIEVVDQMEQERCRRHEAEAAEAAREQAANAAMVAVAWARCTAERCQFPTGFADALLARGLSDLETADVLRAGAHLPLQ